MTVQSLATETTTSRLNDLDYHRHIQSIEDEIAVILSGKTAFENLRLLIRALQRRGILDMVAVDRDSIAATNDDLAAIGRALDMAHERLKAERQADSI